MKSKIYSIIGTLILSTTVIAIEFNEAHKYYCGLQVNDFKSLNVTTCSKTSATKTEGVEDDLSKDIDNILSEVKETTIQDYCKAKNKLEDVVLISKLAPLPNNECLCSLRTKRSNRMICGESLQMDQLKDYMTKTLIENFDEHKRTDLKSLLSIKDTECDLSDFSYCDDKFKDKVIKSNFSKKEIDPKDYGPGIITDKENALNRMQALLEKHDSFSNFLLSESKGDIVKQSYFQYNICSRNEFKNVGISQMRYDLAVIFPDIDFDCNKPSEIASKGLLINNLMKDIFSSKTINPSALLRKKKRQFCFNVQKSLQRICEPKTDFSDILSDFTFFAHETNIGDPQKISQAHGLNCLYPPSNNTHILADVQYTLSSQEHNKIEVTNNMENVKEATEIIEEAKELIEKGSLSSEDKKKIKDIETRLEKMYDISFDLFKDNKSAITQKIKASAYKQEIKRRQAELASLKDEIKKSNTFTFSDKARANKKIKQLSRIPSQDDYYSNSSKTTYSPNFETSPTSSAQEKFAFPSFDNTNDHVNVAAKANNSSPEEDIKNNEETNRRNSASTGNNVNNSVANTNNGSSSKGTLNSSGSVTSPALISLDNYNSIKNYNVPTKKQEKEALYDGQEPEVKAVFLQEEKLMRLFRHKEDRYELEEEFDARKFYANINQFDLKTKELGVIFFKRYAVSDLDSILNN